MGMKKSSAALQFMALAAMMSGSFEGCDTTETENIPKRKLNKPLLFHKQEGVINTIKDYNLIIEGKSKKGVIKQARIKSKIEEWLTSGKLKEEHLKI